MFMYKYCMYQENKMRKPTGGEKGWPVKPNFQRSR